MIEEGYANKKLLEQLKRHEGFRTKPYRCTANKLTVGYGRNLDDVGIHETEAHTLLVNDITAARIALFKALPKFSAIDPVRKNVLVNMVFNLGLSRFLKFRKLIAAAAAEDYEEAAKEMMDSTWAIQVGKRATELARQMRTGEFQDGA